MKNPSYKQENTIISAQNRASREIKMRGKFCFLVPDWSTLSWGFPACSVLATPELPCGICDSQDGGLLELWDFDEFWREIFQ